MHTTSRPPATASNNTSSQKPRILRRKTSASAAQAPTHHAPPKTTTATTISQTPSPSVPLPSLSNHNIASQHSICLLPRLNQLPVLSYNSPIMPSPSHPVSSNKNKPPYSYMALIEMAIN